MNKIVYFAILSCTLISASSSCGNRQVNQLVPDKTEPETEILKAPAPKQNVALSRGVIKSEHEVPVYSRMQGQLLEVTLTEGQKVSKGSTLFRLDDEEFKVSIDLKESELEQAKVKMEELLIGQGYKHNSFDAVPQNILDYARIKSGCNVCEKELQVYRTKLQRTIVKAPVSGVVTSIGVTSYYFVEPGQTLCTIVDTEHLVVDFSILETELSRFHIGDEVSVEAIAFSGHPHKAVIRTIGSIVEENGMVNIVAVLKDIENLRPGMTAIINY